MCELSVHPQINEDTYIKIAGLSSNFKTCFILFVYLEITWSIYPTMCTEVCRKQKRIIPIPSLQWLLVTVSHTHTIIGYTGV